MLHTLQLTFFAIILGLTMPSVTTFAQENLSNKIQKGNVIVTSGYGFPSALRIYLKREKSDEDLSVRGYGPSLLKLEYMPLDKFSIGLSGFYSYSDVYWQANAKTLDGTTQSFRHGVQVWEAAVGLRVNYYFYQKKGLNLYAGAGAGIGFANAETYAFAPKEKIYVQHTFPTPFNFEGTVGGRFFVTNNIGIYSELGIGQSWLLYNYYFIPAAFFQFGLTIIL